MKAPSWPKPSIYPWCSIIITVFNAILFFIVVDLLKGKYQAPEMVAALWMIPVFFLNVFFFWAEYDDYKREKHNYMSWVEETEEAKNYSLRKHWKLRFNQIRNRKNLLNTTQ